MFGGILMVLMFLVALFLILLVLIQRGRGGGLAGAFGGMGGQSAFGTKAGDLFTRITIVVASIWVVLCVLGVKYYNTPDTFSSTLGGAAKARIDVRPGDATGATGAMPINEGAKTVEDSAAPAGPADAAPTDAAPTDAAPTDAAPTDSSATPAAAPAETPAAPADAAPAAAPPSEAPK